MFCLQGIAQNGKFYPPYTKWYQDPFGLRPLELSSAAGFIWGTAAIAACVILTKKDSAFHRKIAMYNESGLSFGYKPPYTMAFQNNMGMIYKMRRWMAVGMDWNAIHFADDAGSTWSFGIRPFARWYFITGKKANVFFEYGAGTSYSLKKFPFIGTGYDNDTARTGTRFNFTTKYGVGTEIHIDKRFYLQAGIRHFHLSNANIKGYGRNPSHDSNGLFMGLMYGF